MAVLFLDVLLVLKLRRATLDIDTKIDFLLAKTIMKDGLFKRLNKLIPSGSHTYSRAHDQFSSNTPPIFKRGKGAYLYDNK